MRLAIAISVGLAGLASSPLPADGPMQKITIDAGVVYIVPESYATAHLAELKENILGDIKIDGFWTPAETDVTVAERIFRELIHQGARDASAVFPDLAPNPDPNAPPDPAAAEQLEHERRELAAVQDHYDAYARQYLGVVVDGNRLVLCNYSDAPKVDPASEFMFVEKYFVPGGQVHFLQCRVDAHEGTWSNASIVGSWLPDK